jgi:hypothetical protein
MSLIALSPLASNDTRRRADADPGRCRALYRSLLEEQGDQPGRPDRFTLAASKSFLNDRLAAVSERGSDMPRDLVGLGAWLDAAAADVKAQWRGYLNSRREGAPRRYFTTRSHALHTLRGVAPTKLVDGAWLFGLLPQWGDRRLHGLIRTYLEELGDGNPSQHHVALYQRLLADNNCETIDGLPDGCYVQGAIQLALAHNAESFLPEIIGFNLGYEQLPLHLLVMAHELRELGLDPTYFSLHVTIDNAGTGHARRALDAVLQNRSRFGSDAAFQRRLAAGYELNGLGFGTTDVIDSFDLGRELVSMLARKAVQGADLHSDRCRIAGRTVNQWLADPSRMGEFWQLLESTGWIQRGADPAQSRFWRLLEGDRAPMFGVFDGYERQLIEDWIRGDVPAPRRAPHRSAPEAPVLAPGGSPDETTAQIVARHLAAASIGATGDADAEPRSLRDELAASGSDADTMAALAAWMSPGRHPTPTGLLATRLYASLLPRMA